MSVHIASIGNSLYKFFFISSMHVFPIILLTDCSSNNCKQLSRIVMKNKNYFQYCDFIFLLYFHTFQMISRTFDKAVRLLSSVTNAPYPQVQDSGGVQGRAFCNTRDEKSFHDIRSLRRKIAFSGEWRTNGG